MISYGSGLLFLYYATTRNIPFHTIDKEEGNQIAGHRLARVCKERGRGWSRRGNGRAYIVAHSRSMDVSGLKKTWNWDTLECLTSWQRLRSDSCEAGSLKEMLAGLFTTPSFPCVFVAIFITQHTLCRAWPPVLREPSKEGEPRHDQYPELVLVGEELGYWATRRYGLL